MFGRVKLRGCQTGTQKTSGNTNAALANLDSRKEDILIFASIVDLKQMVSAIQIGSLIFIYIYMDTYIISCCCFLSWTFNGQYDIHLQISEFHVSVRDREKPARILFVTWICTTVTCGFLSNCLIHPFLYQRSFRSFPLSEGE